MNRKKKYTPGWQTRKIEQDRLILEKANSVLSDYYERQAERERREIQEEQELKRINSRESDQPTNNNREESERKDVYNTQNPAQQRQGFGGNVYSAESPESYQARTSDPMAFQDQFIPSVLDPNYDDWVKRQAQRANKKPANEQSNAERYALAASKLDELVKKDDEKAKENAFQRMNRRVWENNTFGKLNKDKQLNGEEVEEINQYKMVTDPLYARERIDQLHKEIEAQQLDGQEAENVQRPENYYGDSTGLPVGMGGAANLSYKLIGLIKSAYAKSFLSDFIEETNSAQMKTSIGQIQRSKELVDLSNLTLENTELIEKYANNLRQLRRFEEKQAAFRNSPEYSRRIKDFGKDQLAGLNGAERDMYAKLLDENRQIRQQLDTNDWWKNANNLASWAPSRIFGRIGSAIDSVVDDDIGGIRSNLYGLGGKLDDLQALMNSNDRSEKWLNDVVSKTGAIKKQLGEFNTKTASKQEHWTNQALTDAQDMVDWRTGDNWLGLHAEVDPYYAAQKKILENSEFDWSDPVKMAQFGWSGIAGGSNSSWWKSIIGMTAKVGGAIGGAVTTGGTSAAVQAAAIATSFEADKSAGSDENNIESEDRTSSTLRSKLISSEKYSDFIEEGLEQLSNTKRISPELGKIFTENGLEDQAAVGLAKKYDPDVIQKVLKSSKDQDKIKDFVMDMFLAGVWHSKDPEITKMHADAVIGANNQFYNDQPVNTADAAIGSIVDIANLEPVKYLARATKISGKITGRKLANTALGLKYEGFKKGVHNVTNSIADSQISNLVKNGTIKTLDAASKVPAAAYVGSLVGADAGYAASDGSYLGMTGGALAGAGAGYLLHKTPKLIGIEDKIAKAYQNTRAFAYKVPKVWMEAAAVGKGVANIGTRIGLDTGSEMLQEGVQALNARDDANYDVQHNRQIASRVFDDMMLGARAAYIWLNQNDPAMKSESDVYSQMNATPLLTLFGPGTAQTVVQAKNIARDINTVEIVANNIDAARRGDIAELEQGKQYAMRISKEDKDEMHNKFEQFRAIAGRYADARQKLNPQADQESLMQSDSRFIPSELIDEQEKDYEDIYTLANSSFLNVLGDRAKAKPGTEKYAQLVSMESFRRKKRAEAFEALKAKDEENARILGQDALEGYLQQLEAEEERSRSNGNFEEDYIFAQNPDEKTIREEAIEKNDIAKMLVHAATLMRIVEDYSALQQLTGKENVFLDRSKQRLKLIKDELKKHGFNVETIDDVNTELNLSEEGIILQNIIDRSRMAQQNQTSLTMSDYIDAYSDMLRERELLEFDFLMQDQLLKDFHSAPEEFINQWNSRLKSDQQLESILEDDYINSIRDYESAAAREVKDNDIYVGDDGYWYITKKVGDKIEKHRYHPNSRVIDPEDRGFNPVEYDKAKKDRETSLLERAAVEKANKKIQTGTTEQTLHQEPETPETVVEEPEPAVDETEGNVLNIGDFVTTSTGIAQIIGQDDDGNFILSYGAGRPETSVEDPTTLKKVDSPITPAKYHTGEIISANDGRKYTVGDVYMESIDSDTYEPTYSYDLIDIESGETLPNQSIEQINKMTAVKPVSKTGSTVEPNDAQNEVIQWLQEKLKRDKRDTELTNGVKRRSGYDYFIKIKQKIQRFVRVHGVLDNLFEEDQIQKTKRNNIILELSQLYDEDKKKFQDKVIQLQDEYNADVAKKYGQDSPEYGYYAIDLQYYLRGNVLNDRGIIEAIASILSSEQPGPAVVVGSIIDEIARIFFDPNKEVENKPEYRMSDSVFNSIISQLNDLQQRFNDLGWVVDTNSYTWFGQFPNGVKMAGETDMIAIDKQGNIHILDFKTTKDQVKFDTQLEYKTKDLAGNDVWMPIDPKNVPEGAETRVSSPFLTDIATKSGGIRGKRTYAAQYARQLEAYRLLIQQQTGRKVTSLEVIPFAVDYEIKNDKVTKISSTNVYDPVNLSDVEELKSDISEIDNYLNSSEQNISPSEAEGIIEDIRSLIQDANSRLESKGISADTSNKLREIIQDLLTIAEKLDQIKDDRIKLADTVYVQGLLNQRDSLVRDLNYNIQQADEQITAYEDSIKSPKDPVILDKERSWLGDEVEEVMPDEQKRWWHFNSLHSFSQVIKDMKDYMKNNIKSDFIKNGTFVISRDDKNDLDVFSVTITYRGITFKPIKINIGKNDSCPFDMRNQEMVPDNFLGAMGRNFLRQYYQLAKTLKPGEQIVATKVTRTNGVIKYSGKNKNLQNTKFFSKNDPRLLSLINGVDSLVGVSDGGIIIEVGSGNRETIWSPEFDQDGNMVSKKIRDRVVPGNIDNDSIPDGVVVFLHKFKNEEDPEDAPMRVVPLVLQGKNLDNYDGKLILKILLDIAGSKTPEKTANELYTFKAKLKNGSSRNVVVPGLTNLKVLKLLTRFGKQAEYAGDEFIFDYATKEDDSLVAGHKVIRITDMRVDATEDEEGNLHRPTIDLDLRKAEDVDQLLEILSKTQMHINQMGTMRTNLNTDNENSPFGALRTFFLDEANQDVKSIMFNGSTQIDVEDVFPDKSDPTKGLTGIAWAIKHGYAATNAESLENPIISIHELGIEDKKKKESSKKKQQDIDKKIEKPETQEEKPTISVQQNEPEPQKQSEEIKIDDDDVEQLLRKMMEDDDDLDTQLPGGGLTVEALREKPISEEEKKEIEKRLHRLLGKKFNIQWVQGAVDVLKSGASVAGRTAITAIKLSDRLPEGTELHEAFHRIFEILIPNNRRQKMYDLYRQKYNEQFKKANGRDLTDRDISEDFAEMFRLWVMNKQEVKLHWNILKTFREIKQYCDDLRNFGDRRFAALFMLANSGIFRFIKPDAENIKHFTEVLGGVADMRLSAKDNEGNLINVELDKFPSFGGRSLFNDAISGIIYALFNSYSIDMLASNAARLKTSREDIANLYRGKEKTKHSSWFRVLTGEYTTSDEKFTVEDANTYYRIYKQSDEIKQIAREIIKELIKDGGQIDRKEFKVKMLATIYKRERDRSEEDLNQNQKMMAQLFDESTWWIVEKKINNKLHKMSIDSERRTEEEYTDALENGSENTEDPEEESLVSKDIGDHKDEFYDHARTDDATAAIRFFLSTIPDERFASEEDVENGIVRSIVDKNGDPVTVSNSTNLLGYQQFLSMKIVSNKLLLACHDVSSVEELDERLQNLANTDPIFYRIAKKYRSALRNEILHTPDGKNRITLNGKVVDQSMYEQGKDELGWYYVWTDAGEHPGERIEGAVTQTNPDMESFVTQLFNYVACQKLDFIMVTLRQALDSDGEAIEGNYTAEVRSSDSDYAASVLPNAWFTRLRSGVSGIFKLTNAGKYTFETGGKELFYDSINTLKKIRTAFQSTGVIKIHDRDIDKNTDEGFRLLEYEFIKALNNLGIDITREALEYYLQEQFGRSLPIRRSFGQLISRKEKDTSFSKFIDALDYLKEGVTERGENSILTQDRDEQTIGFGRNAKRIKRSGSYIYSQNGFVKWMSRAASRYNKVASEIMTNGPENTKRYMLSQSHTASDITDNFNKAVIVDGEIKGSRMLKDMSKYIYNTVKGIKDIPKGSIIIKQLYFSADKKLHLVLHTHGGVKVDTNHDGGVSYRKITEREDWIAKAAILKQGGIIFPTLSDKSTWFYLTGVSVPGIDYTSVSQMSPSKMLHLGIHIGQKPNSKEIHTLFDFNAPNAQLDQMIEYAECERAAIEREINRGKKGTLWENLKQLPFIESFNENRKRFGGLSEVVVIDNNGKAKLEIINDYDKSPEDCLKRADDLFFNKSAKDKRKIMALTLEEGFLRNMAMLERSGLIVATDTSSQQNRLTSYRNVGLDYEAINALRSLYIEEIKEPGKNLTPEQSAITEAQAIAAYVWDIYLRGIISNEEVERMYTGQPQFFKWKHDRIKDSISGKVMNVLTDRHGDESKRLGGLGSTGDKNRTDLANMRTKYKCAEVEDQIVKSKLYDNLKQSFIDNYIRDTYITYKEDQILNDPNLTDQQKDEQLDAINDSVYGESKITLEKIKEELDKNGMSTAYNIAVANAEKDASAYSGDINVADGAAYITPKMAKDLLRQRGRFTSRVKEAFDILEGKKFVDGKHVNPLNNKEAFLIVSEALLGAQKYSAYGYRIDESTGDIPVHYYNKFALFPLFPQIATGFSSDILKKMEEDGIDMLMMHSAVKTGSQEATKCEPEMFENAEAFKNFHFKTYSQDFAFIRRQLNTDPRERETVAMGTQMTKIALSNLKKWRSYKRADGSTIRGRDLLKNIMNSIKQLSDLGRHNIENEFFTNGKLDLKKLSLFLEAELERRDADANLLDGIEIIEDEDGTQHFKVTLEAMSSVDWIQSIIVSKINKEVCDINVKGNAFYQRSVWGMEGKPKVLDDKQVNFKMNNINGGEDLNLINEDGSMDAVISIDFFEDIIPEGIRGNFNKSKQWLIDHKIIGPNAKANTIASRIPTQAQSSIHALRFVDVLPVVRDTIILPREFTKTTGSDFDIDKLYLVMLSYWNRTRKENGKIIDEISTEFDKDKDPINYYRNELINDYLTLLKSHGKQNRNGIFENGDSIHISMRSIDDDTNLVKNVLKRIEENRPVERSYAYKFGNIAFQVATKAAFMIGKFGIGPFALNNNSQILTELYGVRFAKSSTHRNILDSLGCLSLSNPRDKQNKSILSWLSGLINAHVDVAKDPYIRRLNINTFTYNLTNLLIRTGMGERTLLFTMQPIMVDLARVYDDASGSYMTDVNISKSARQRSATRNFVIDQYKRGNSTNGDIKFIDEMLMNPKKNSDEQNRLTEEILGSYAQALFGIDNNGNYETSFLYINPATGDVEEKNGCILEDILTNPEALDSTKKGFTFDNIQGNRPLYRVTVKNRNGAMEQVDMSPRDVELYVYFIQNALSKYGQKLSDLVNACKIDTKKQGKSYVEQQAYLNKYNQLFNNEDDIFENEGLQALKKESYIDQKTKNAIDLYERILSQISIQSTATFKDAHERILTKLNSSSQNKQLSKKVTNAIMTWLKSKFFEQYVEQRGSDYFDNLFYGKNSIQSRLIRLQNEIKRDKSGKFSKFGDNGDITLGENGKITNPLLKALQPDIYEDQKDFNSPLFIKLENALLDDSDNMNALERAWDELYRDTYHYTEDEDGTRHYYVKEFAEDLAVYAFLTSGDKNGTTRFFKCVPNTIRTALSIKLEDQEKCSYAQYIANLQQKFIDGEYDFSDRDIEDIIGQNWYDNDFVKEIKMSRRRGKNRIALNTSFGTITAKSKQTVSYKKKNGKVGFKKENVVKTLNIFIAGVRKTKNGTEETIHRSNDDMYPPFVKIRRPGSTKYDADNYILYRFKESLPIDPTDPNSQTFPVYQIVNPSVSNMRAGSYEYTMFDYGKDSPSYPLNIQEILRKLSEDFLTSDENADKAVQQFVNALNNMGVSLQEDMLEDLLREEFDGRNFEYTEQQLQAVLNWIKKNMKTPEEGGTVGERGNKKPTKSTKNKSEGKYNMNDIFGEDEEVEIGTNSQQNDSQEEEQQERVVASEDLFDDDDFDDLAQGVCTGKIKPGE